MEKIVLAHCDTYEIHNVKAAVASLLLPFGGLTSLVTPGERILLKPNLLSAKHPDAAVTTHPALVHVLAELLIAEGCEVIIGDSPGIGSFQRVAETCGMSYVARATGATLCEFKTPVEHPGSGTFRSVALAEEYWQADKVINLPKLKTHEMMTMTCAVKNLFGAVIGTDKAAWHLKAGQSRELFARLLLEIYLLKPPTLTIVDAVTAMEGNGPGSGNPTHLGALLAGTNPVAVDVVAGKLAGIPGDLLPVEQEAKRMGLRGSGLAEIAVEGAALEEFNRPPFQLPDGLDVQFGLPEWVKRAIRRHLLAYPAACQKTCLLCGVCRDACPPAAITITEKKLRVDHNSCIRCWCCRELCPHDAMEISQGWLGSLHMGLKKRKLR